MSDASGIAVIVTASASLVAALAGAFVSVYSTIKKVQKTVEHVEAITNGVLTTQMLNTAVALRSNADSVKTIYGLSPTPENKVQLEHAETVASEAERHYAERAHAVQQASDPKPT